MITNAATEPSYFDEFFKRNSPPTGFFEVELSCREVFVFRVVRDADELGRLNSDAREFIKGILDGDIHPAVQPYVSRDPAVLANVSFLSALHEARFRLETGEGMNVQRVEEPRFEQAHFLRMAKKWPYGFQALRDALDHQLSVGTKTRVVEAVNAAKKD